VWCVLVFEVISQSHTQNGNTHILVLARFVRSLFVGVLAHSCANSFVLLLFVYTQEKLLIRKLPFREFVKLC
jgi:hypothetical protein